jgi:hypothetical protein
VVLLGLFGGLLTYWATPPQLIKYSDTLAYLSSAHGLVHGHGPTLAFAPPFSRNPVAEQLALLGRIPMEGWPPGYPVLLAIGMRAGIEPLSAARWFAVGAGALIGAAAAWILRRRFRLPLPAVLAVGGLVVLGPNHLVIDLSYLDGRALALSEGIFVPVSVAVLAIGMVALARRSWWWVAAACGSVAAASMVRSTGPVLGIALALGALVDPLGRGWSKRFARGAALVLAGSGVAANVALVLVNRLAWDASGHSSRQLGWYPDASLFRATCRTVSGWFGISESSPMVVAVGVTLIGFVAPTAAVCVPRLRRALARERPVEQAALAVLGVAIAGGWAAVVATFLTLNRNVPPSPRHLSIVQPFVYLLDGVVIVRLLERVPVPGVVRSPGWQARRTLGASAILLGCALAPAWWTIGSIRQVRPSVIRTARTAELTDFGPTPRSILLASDSPQRVWNTARRPVLLVPPARFATTQRANPDLRDNQNRIASLTRSGTLLLVAYGTGGLDDSALRALSERTGATRQARCADGSTLWAIPGTPAQSAARKLCQPVSTGR